MEIKKRRNFLSLLFVFLWGVLFTIGVFIVLSFLAGVSVFDSRIVQKGYAFFSSDFPLFLNGQYLSLSDRYNQYEVGKYDVCVDDFEKKEVCYNDIRIEGNDKPSQHLEDIVPESADGEGVYQLSERDDVLVFSSNNTAVAWYDVSLRQIFYINAFGEGVVSLFPSFDVVKGRYNTEKMQFEFLGKQEKEIFVVPDSEKERYSFFLEASKKTYLFSDWFFSVERTPLHLFGDVETQLLGVYSSKMHHVFHIQKNMFVVFFDSSVYVFSVIRNAWSFVAPYDGGSGFCTYSTHQCYFLQGGRLVGVSL